MLKDKFIGLVNSSKYEEFSDIPEGDVKFICSRLNEIWSIYKTFPMPKIFTVLKTVLLVCVESVKLYQIANLNLFTNCEAFELEEK